MGLQEYQQRVVDEKAELDGKLQRLRAFFETDVFASLPDDERDRLLRQSTAMREYSTVLNERIEAWDLANSNA